MDKRPKSLKRIVNKKQAEKYIKDQIATIKKQVGKDKVLLALSDGVDSSVTAALLIKAIGRNLICMHVNHGLLRQGESEQVIKVFRKNLGANLKYVNATELFLNKLKNVADPEKKRKIIGKVFIDVFAKEAKKIKGIKYLAQGTIYPDILESKGVKAHHNVGGLPKSLNFKLVEPVKYLYKDEVRIVGLALGLPKNMVYRQPFPGPGLGVRCVGAITRDRLNALRAADAIVRKEIGKLKKLPWQYFCIVPDIKSTGIKNGKRYMGWPVIIRAIDTRDAVTAKSHEIPYKVLYKIRDKIIKEIKGVNRVLLDFSDKPVAT
ncbi:MAG: glutamine-hydrolyzing GMP synthase, partial [Lachnospiraceae bacterium]|nr:glutamine-hydrolyzing GMP synthase [Lachnospiraceae bacterium]